MTTFQRGETIVCTRNVKSAAGAYVSPDTSYKLTIYSPSEAKVVDAKDMVEGDPGKFHYDYTSASDAQLGYYTIVYTAVDQSRTVIFRESFLLESQIGEL